MFNSKFRYTHSQNLKKYYHDAGQFYFAKTDAILNDIPTLSENSYPVIIPNYRIVDIDNLNDWKRAEVTYKVLKNNSF